MDTKLTLTLDKQIIKRAKLYAKKHNRSLSDLIESYLKVLTGKESEEDFKNKLSPTVRAMLGSLKMPADSDYRKTLQEELWKRYNR